MKVIEKWLRMNPCKESRPKDVEDILEEIILAISKVDSRWKLARPSDKKCTRKRYKALYDAYRGQRELFDKDRLERVMKKPKQVTFEIESSKKEDLSHMCQN